MSYGLLIGVVFLAGVVLTSIGWKLEQRSNWNSWMWLIMVGIIGMVMCWVPSLILYRSYEVPVINDFADKKCQKQGYDTFETWGAPGFFPQKPLYIKCKKYDNTIMGTINLNKGE